MTQQNNHWNKIGLRISPNAKDLALRKGFIQGPTCSLLKAQIICVNNRHRTQTWQTKGCKKPPLFRVAAAELVWSSVSCVLPGCKCAKGDL